MAKILITDKERQLTELALEVRVRLGEIVFAGGTWCEADKTDLWTLKSLEIVPYVSPELQNYYRWKNTTIDGLD